MRFVLCGVRLGLHSSVALGLCIGANTAIFTIVNTILFRPLDFPQQEQLIYAGEGLPKLGYPEVSFSCPDYLFVASHSRSFQSTAVYQTRLYELSGIDRPERVYAARVTASLFSVLGVTPAVGRAFTQAETDHFNQVAVVTDGFSNRIFGGSKAAVRQTIYLERKPYRVIGVMPPRFSFPLRGLKFNSDSADVFVPAAWTKDERQSYGENYDHDFIGRLRSGVTAAQAGTEMRSLLNGLQALYPPELRNLESFQLSIHVAPFRDVITGAVKQPLLILWGAVVLVLLIGCADVANLMLSRTVTRQREFAVRVALGAGPGRLMRQMFAEGLVLAAAGGAAGFLLAFWALPLLLRFAPDSLPRLHEIGLDWRVLGFVAATTLATPLVFCLAPAIDVAKAAIADRLREGARTGTQSKRQRRFMSTAVVTQFVLAFVLLSGAGLLARSFVRASESDPGFKPDHVLSVGISLPSTAYRKPENVAGFYREILERASVLPGVLDAGDISELPMNRTGNSVYTVEGRQTKENSFRFYVSGNAMRLLRLPLLSGRYIDARDGLNAPPVVVISESIAKTNWPGQDPIGRRVKFGIEASPAPWMTVVGVVKDVRDSLASTAPRSLMFLSAVAQEQIFHSSVRNRRILMRTSQDPELLSNAIRQQIHQLDPALPLQQVQTLSQWLGKSLEPERFRTFLLAVFAGTALLLATLGIGGLLAYNVAQRRKEFGVRIALGASQRDLASAVLKEGCALRFSALSGESWFRPSRHVQSRLSSTIRVNTTCSRIRLSRQCSCL
jgi:putative ABC transport system permease protein